MAAAVINPVPPLYHFEPYQPYPNGTLFAIRLSDLQQLATQDPRIAHNIGAFQTRLNQITTICFGNDLTNPLPNPPLPYVLDVISNPNPTFPHDGYLVLFFTIPGLNIPPHTLYYLFSLIRLRPEILVGCLVISYVPNAIRVGQPTPHYNIYNVCSVFTRSGIATTMMQFVERIPDLVGIAFPPMLLQININNNYAAQVYRLYSKIGFRLLQYVPPTLGTPTFIEMILDNRSSQRPHSVALSPADNARLTQIAQQAQVVRFGKKSRKKIHKKINRKSNKI